MSSKNDKSSLPLSEPKPGDPSPNVPTFSCLVYLSKDESGVTHARVANLDSLKASSVSPRDAMARVCREFKERVRGAYAAGEADSIAWIDPPLEPTPDEQVRSIPVHL